MCAIIGNVIGGVIAFIITAVKSTLFWGGDALICGIGNWFMNIIVDPIVSTVCGPIVGGLCGTIVGGGGAGLISGLTNLIGGWLTQGCGEIFNTVRAIISGIIPK